MTNLATTRRGLLQGSAALAATSVALGAASRSGAAPENLAPLAVPAGGVVPVAFPISDGAVLIDFAGPWEVFGNASYVGADGTMDMAGKAGFNTYTVAEKKSQITVGGGMKIMPDYTFADAPSPKLIVIPAQGGAGDAMIAWIRAAAKTADVTMSICTGAFVLAQTGLLSGRSATTHHGSYADLAMQYPDIRVKRGYRFVDEGNIATSGGLTCGVDLAFHIVERYSGRKRAEQTALNMEYQGRGWMDASGADKAATLYQEAIQKQPDDYCLHENYADFLTAVGDLKRAEAEWRRVRELVPHDYLAHFKLGWLLERQGRLSEAEAELRQAGVQRPYMIEVCFELGEVLVAEGKLEAALQERQRALRLRPHDDECLYQLGKTLALLNRRAEAIQSLQEAVRLHPSHWQAHYGLGGQLALESRVGEARIEFEQVIRIKPDFALAHLNLGVALMKEGRFAEAANEFEKTAQLDPANQLAPNYLRQARASQKPK